MIDQDEPAAMTHMSCRTIAILFIGSAVLWIIVGYGIGKLIGVW